MVCPKLKLGKLSKMELRGRDLTLYKFGNLSTSVIKVDVPNYLI